MTTRPRPLSPHLQIYRFTITMAMSIMHRITGAANYFGSLLLVIWLGSAALGGDAFAYVNGLFGSWLGQLILFGFTWSLFHHMLGGLRHFVWDAIQGLEPGQREALSWLNLVASIFLTLVAWAVFVWF